MRSVFASTLLVGAFLAATALQAAAQERNNAQADSQMARIARTLGPHYVESVQMMHYRLANAEPITHDFTWDKCPYVVVATGDDHVTAITLRLYAAHHVLVAADTSGSRTPRVRVTVPDYGTPYRLEMAITGCSQYPCTMALMPYRQQ